MKKSVIVCLVLSLATFGLFAQETIDAKTSAENKISASEFNYNIQMAMSNAEYMVTPGDVYSLTYAANGTPVSYTIAVDSTYRIRVSNLAVMDATGKSYLRVKKEVEEIVQKNYPMSGVQFVLMNPATFKVVVTGEVGQTVERQAWALSRLSSVVAGAATGYASLRDVTVTSANGKKNVYDLFKAQREGDFSQDPYVAPNDVITLNRMKRVVTISGAVERPGTYQLKDGENLKELVEYYGNGLAPMADTSRIQLTAMLDKENQEKNKAGLRVYLNQKSIDENYELSCYDAVYISSYSDLKPVMFMEGAIMANKDADTQSADKQAVRFENGTNYAYLVRSYAGWFMSPAADTEHAYVIRGDKFIPVNLNDMLYDQSFYSDLMVEPSDTLMVPFKQYFVSVAGAVMKPGRYPYIPDRDYEYYIGLAGGFNTEMNSGKAVTIKDMNGKTLSKNAVITPETTITAKSNSFLYNFGRFASPISVFLSLLSTILSIVIVAGNMGR